MFHPKLIQQRVLAILRDREQRGDEVLRLTTDLGSIPEGTVCFYYPAYRCKVEQSIPAVSELEVESLFIATDDSDKYLAIVCDEFCIVDIDDEDFNWCESPTDFKVANAESHYLLVADNLDLLITDARAPAKAQPAATPALDPVSVPTYTKLEFI